MSSIRWLTVFLFVALNLQGCLQLGTDQQFSFPNWGGSYPVGVKSVILTDESRDESFTPFDPDDRRKLIVEFFYPSVVDPNAGRLEVISDSLWLPGFINFDGKFLRRSNYVSATWNISKNTPINNERESYPLLVFSHGYGLVPAHHVSILGELASHGYIIAAINHTYGSTLAEFPGENSVSAVPISKYNAGAFLPIWSDDQVFVISEIASLNADSNSFLYQNVDLDRIGAFGHSYGGAASYHAAAKDTRIIAAINMDGGIWDYEDKLLQQPFAVILAEDYFEEATSWLNNVNNESYMVLVDDFHHATFSDLPLWYQWDYPGENIFGPIDAHRGQELVTGFITQFFEKYFYNASAPWFDDPDSMPLEAVVEKR